MIGWVLTLGASLAAAPTGGELLEALVARPGEGRPAARQRLVELGQADPAALFSLVEGSGLDALLGEEAPPELSVPVGEIDDLALEAWGNLPSQRVYDYLEGAVRSGAPSERLARVRILGGRAEAEGLELLLEDLEGLGPAAGRGTAAPRVAAAFTAILGKDPTAYRGLGEALDELDHGAALRLLEILADVPDPRAADLLSRRLGVDGRQDPYVAEALGRLAGDAPWAAPDGLAGLLQARLANTSTVMRLACVRALWRIADPEGIDGLVRATADPDLRVAREAQRALRDLVGGREDLQPAAWRARLEDARRAWEEEAPAAIERLRSGDAGAALAAARELRRHRLYRHEVALEVAGRFGDFEPASVPAFVALTVRLESRHVVPDLVTLLGSADPAVRSAAHAGLVRLTGWDLAAEPWLWQRRLRGAS